MSRRPTVPYKEIIGDVKTGDLIFGRGMGWSSRVIEFFTGGKWSHVAMVILPRDLGIESDKPLLWEATSVEGLDIATPPGGGKKKAAMLLWLEDRLTEYFESDFYKVMGLRFLDTDRNEAFRNGLKSFVLDQAVRRATYPEEYQIMKDFLEHRYLQTVEQGTFYCSELVATTYQAMELLPEAPHPQSYSPRDFSETGHIPILRRSALGKESWLSQK